MKLAGKFTAALVAGIFAALLIAGCGGSVEAVPSDGTESPAVATSSIGGDDFSIKVSCGLDGNYRSGAALPVTLTLESLKEDFEGVVRIIVPGDSDWGEAACAYEKEIMLTAGEEKTVSLSVYNSSGGSRLVLQIENGKGKTVLEESVVLSGKSSESALVGVLSDDYTALSYFDQQLVVLGDYDYDGNVQLLELDASMLPEQASGLDVLSYLIINSYDSSRLSEAQIAAIISWVEHGGVLILGGGSDYQQTLSAFQNTLIAAEVSGMAEGTLKLDEQNAVATESLAFTKDDGILSMSLKDGEKLSGVLEQSGLVWTQEVGQGRVAVTAMNLGMEPLVSWADRESFAVQLLQQTADGYSAQRIASVNYGYYSYSYDLVNAVNGLYEAKTPSVGLISVLLLIFVLACPVLYLVLKAMGRRELLWALIPVLAVCFTAVIFVATGDIRIKNPIESSVTVVYEDAGSDTGTEQTVNMAILVPDAELTRLQLNSGLSGIKIYSSYSYSDVFSYMFGTASGSSSEYNVAVRETAEGYQLGLNNGETFQTNYFSFEGESGADLSGGLVTDYVKNTTGISGTVTNKTGYDLRGVCVLMDSCYVMIGDLAAGETASFEETDNVFFYYFDLYDVNIPGIETYSDEYYHLINIYEMVYDQYLYESLEYGTDPMATYVMAYVDEWDADYVADEEVPEYNKAVLLKKEDVGYSDYDGACVLRLFNYSSYMSDDWDPYDGELYALTVDENFELGAQIDEIYALSRAADSQAVWGTTSHTRIYAWNYGTQTYDELFTDDLTEEFADGCPYLSESGQLRLRFTCQAEWTDYAPEITVIGGVE